MPEEKKVTPQEFFANFPEAPASDTFKWIDGLGIEHMTTIRAWTPDQLYSKVSEFAQNLIETGAKPGGPQPAPKPATPPAGTAETVATGTSLKIAKIKVTPEAERIMVELYEDGHKWPDIKAFYKNAGQASAAFAEVTQLDFSEPGEYSLNCIADYRLSEKLNSKGNPYKNLVSVRM